MEIHDETTAPLQTLWENKADRQKCQIVLMEAIGNASDVSVRVANDILIELDRLLDKDKEEITRQKNPGLWLEWDQAGDIGSGKLT